MFLFHIEDYQCDKFFSLFIRLSERKFVFPKISLWQFQHDCPKRLLHDTLIQKIALPGKQSRKCPSGKAISYGLFVT